MTMPDRYFVIAELERMIGDSLVGRAAIALISAQAPKPASAGGEPIPPFEPTNAMSTAGKHYMKGQEELFERQQAIGCWRVMYKAWQESIAAEADTAKVCAECGGIDRYHVTTCSKSLLIETLAADRLAPIEARGAVNLDNHPHQKAFSDAIMGALMFGFQQNNKAPDGHWLEPFWNFGNEAAEAAKRAEKSALLLAKTLRARESAPAVERGQVAERKVVGAINLTSMAEFFRTSRWLRIKSTDLVIEFCASELDKLASCAITIPPSVATGCAVEVTDPFADKYHELLLAVASKFPGESRHATALRYIHERESDATRAARET